MRQLILLVSLILLIPAVIHADIYQFVDENGTVHFTNVQRPGAVRIAREARSGPATVGDSAPQGGWERARAEARAAVASAAGGGTTGGSIRSIVEEKASRYRLDPQLLMEVIRAESDFNPYAVSPKGARGLMQLMPGTASRLGVRDSFDPEQNIDGGTRYLRYLLEYFNGSVPLALAAYNAGENAVTRWQNIPPYKETQLYVKKIMKNYGQTTVGGNSEVSRTASIRTSVARRSRKDEAVPIRQVVAEDGSVIYTNLPETYVR